MPEGKGPLRKKIAATKRLKEVMANHFFELDEAARTGSRKIAWCTSTGPAELLRGMGFLVYYPENHGAMLGATRMASGFIPYANAIGYSPETSHNIIGVGPSAMTSIDGHYFQNYYTLP
ncbi:MAG: hypothetical protein QGG48_09595, partial [Desulfatiglandales bacterium]|nr:hypothetical protein [Desulfatiglandales bacterium]